MFERYRDAVKTFLIIGLILAALIAFASCSPVSIIPDQPTPTAGLAATPTSTTQLTQPAEAARPTQALPTAIPTHTSSPAPTAQPLPPPLPPPVGNGSKLGVHGIWSNRILEFTQTLADAASSARDLCREATTRSAGCCASSSRDTATPTNPAPPRTSAFLPLMSMALPLSRGTVDSAQLGF